VTMEHGSHPRPRAPLAHVVRELCSLLVLTALVGACSKRRGSRSEPPRAVVADLRGALTRPGRRIRLRRGRSHGIPVHPLPFSRRVVARIPGGTEVAVLASRRGGRWLEVRAPDGTRGWIIRRYVGVQGRQRPRHHWGAGQARCPLPPPGPAPRLKWQRALEVPQGRGLPPLRLPRVLTVASYNVWELYDGEGGDRYLSRYHADALSPGDVKLRVAKLAAALRPAMPHVIVFQEIESGQLACRVARLVVPRARWRCGAGVWSRRASPQNIAVASRVGGSMGRLRPAWRFAPRGAVELVLGGGRLVVLGVHLKSSRGRRGLGDCRNAARRAAMARALVAYLGKRHPGAAALLVGDFNVDPLRAQYDQTASVLLGARLESLRRRFYPDGAPATYPHYRSVIDLAFFRPAQGVVAKSYRVLAKARVGRWTSDHRPVVVKLSLARVAAR